MPLPQSTFNSDPAITHYVEVVGGGFGAGVFGYYTSKHDADLVAQFLKEKGAQSSIIDHNPSHANPSFYEVAQGALKLPENSVMALEHSMSGLNHH